MPHLSKEPDPNLVDQVFPPADFLDLVTRDPYKERDWKAALHFPRTFHNPD